MSTTHLRTAAALVLATALPLGLGALPSAGAAGTGPATISASVTDSTPASGQLFRVSGRLTRDGDGIGGKTVKVQTLRDGSWSTLTGAQMKTSSTGGYDLGVVLSQTGKRTLRVKALLPGRDPRKRFVVTVH
jgi:hypothetical protein